MGSTRGTSKHNGRKDKFDRFYTPQESADYLTGRMLGSMSPETIAGTLFVEPSAGSGSFVTALEKYGIQNIIAIDLCPVTNATCHTEIHSGDFLKTSHNDLLGMAGRDFPWERIVFVGNPPFGVQGDLSIAFVNHCLELGSDVWFILPPTFRKESYCDRIPNGMIADVIEMPVTSYSLPDGSARVVPSAFIHYMRVASKPARIGTPELLAMLPFEFVSMKGTSCKTDCFTIRRVGGTAGKASERTDVSPASNYLCRLHDGCGMSVDDVIKMINAIEFPERDWTVGPRSLSMREIANGWDRTYGKTYGML